MPKRLHSALTDFKATSKIPELYGILGITINGARTVEVPNRDGFVYVRLRDSTSELIQAFNETVSPVYDLPVKLKRDGNRYYIIGRDTQRYQNWGTVSPFLPRHGDQHSFNDTGGGGDIVWVYQQQFMPMLALPSGTDGGPNVMIANILLRNNTGWIYAGGTGTFNMVQYKPTDNQAIMGLVYINRDTGNPGFLINSGTPFAATLTGTANVAPYIPYPSDTSLLPVVAIRLVSGTQSLVWGNMYEARQLIDYYTTGSGGGISSIAIQDEGIAQGNATTLNFVGAGVTASVSGSVALINVAGGGSTTPGGSDTNVQYNVSGTFGGDSELVWNYDNRYLRIGPAHSENLDNHQMLVVGRTPNAVPLNALFAYGTGTATAGSPHPTFIGYRQRGLTLNAPEAIRDNDGLALLVGAGYQGDVFTNSARVRLSAQGDWITGTYSGSKAEIQITPSGTNSRVTRFEVVGNGSNLPDGIYMISGSPHSHFGLAIVPGGRLTLVTGTPVPTTSVSGTSIHYVPYLRNVVPLYEGALGFVPYEIPSLTLNLISNTGTVNAHTANKNFDLFVMNDAGTFRLVSGPQWTSDTSRSPTLLERMNGTLVNGENLTVRYGSGNGDTTTLSAHRGLYVGSFRTTANGVTEFSVNRRLIWNMYNRKRFSLEKYETTNSWSVTNTANFASMNGSTLNRVEIINGVQEDFVNLEISATIQPTTNGFGGVAIGEDSVTQELTDYIGYNMQVNVASAIFPTWKRYTCQIFGYHYYQALQICSAATLTMFGKSPSAPIQRNTGIIGDWLG